MRRLFTLLAIMVLALSTLSHPAALLAAPGDISVTSSTYENRFPNELIFRLQAKSSAEIKKATLYYKVSDSTTLSYIPASVTPGTSISTQVSLNLQKTYFPPFTDISFQWLVEDAAGNSLRSEFTSLSLEDVRFKWTKLSREGVTLYWYKGSQATANELLDAASAALKRLSTEIGITYERPMKIIVYDSKTDMDPAIPKRSDTYSRETTTLGVRLSADVLCLLGNQGDVKGTLAHELNHMVVHQMVDNPYGDIPSWLDEGLSMLAEGDLPSGYKRAVDDGVRRDDLLSVRSMTSYSGDPGKVNLYYGESYSVVKYLVDNYGRDKMVELLKVFKEGTAPDDALRKVYGFTTDELDAKWRASLGLSARPSKDNGIQSNSTPVPTIVPFGVGSKTTSSDLVRTLVWICVPVVFCTVIIVLVVLVFLVLRSRRR